MKLTFNTMLERLNITQRNIIEDMAWHVEKVYNTLLYEIINKKREVDFSKNLNILSSKIYTEYRKNNWHSKYLHSHTLRQTILNTLQNFKSYLSLNQIY